MPSHLANLALVAWTGSLFLAGATLMLSAQLRLMLDRRNERALRPQLDAARSNTPGQPPR